MHSQSDIESTIGTSAKDVAAAAAKRLENSAKRTEALFKAKTDGAKAIAESSLSEAEKRSRLDKLLGDSDLESVLTQSVESAGLTKATNFGAEREAVSREFYNKPYSDLSQDQQAKVNLELPARTAPSLEIVRDETGAYIIDKAEWNCYTN